MISVNVQKRLGDFTLDAAFEAPAGVTAIFGRSGSGKTTLVNAVAGLVTPDTGRVAINGRVLFDAATNLSVSQRRLGYVFQEGRLFPHMSVEQNLTYGGHHDRAQVIDMLGLGALLARRPTTLSGGEQQRVALGRALMSGPQVLLMDEPLSALDGPRKAEILPYLERLRDHVQIPILYVSHAMSEVARLATTLVILQEGQVLKVGPVADILADPVLLPIIGVREAGAVLNGRITEINAMDGLSRVRFDGGDMQLPGRLGAMGQSVRLRIPAQDVILARERPEGISALNVWPMTITQINIGTGPGVAIVLAAQGDRILARITRRSAQSLDLKVGQDVFAILKATAVAATDIGQQPT